MERAGTHARETENATHWWCVRCRSSGLLHAGTSDECACGGNLEELPAFEVEVRRAEPLVEAFARRFMPLLATKEDPSSDRDAYPIPQAARRLGVGLTKMKELIRDGHVETVRIGRRYFVPRSELDRMTRPATVEKKRTRSPARSAPSNGAALKEAILRGGSKH